MSINMKQRAELKKQAQQYLARQHYADYFSLSNPTYFHMAHTRYISHYLNRIANGEQLNLLVEIPPRHGKSALITETFPSYYLMKNPDKKVISTAYSDSLARKFGRLNRNKFREHGLDLFEADLSDDNSSAGDWSTTDGGGMISTGIMGSLTGEGADCFPEGTLITTEIGQVDIKDLFEMENPPRVLTFNHDTDRLEYKKIGAKKRVVADGLTEISTTSGIKIRSTNEHHYYTNGTEYRSAHLIGRKDKLTVETVTKEQSCCTSQRRNCDKQFIREFDNCMRDLSCDSSQIRSESIQSVESIKVDETFVYDIQVQDNHNFFANTILVHNCMIIDDPVKNKHEAYSKTYRDRVWDEWEATLSTRLHDGASVIVVQTRWHEDDLTGRLLENKGRKWIRIRIPAIAEEDDLLGREVGQALAPELGYDEEWAKNKKIESGTMTWNALFQQRPTSETGTIVKREWIQYYDTLPSRVNYYSISWDLAVKDGDNNDYSVGQCWAVISADRYLVDQVRAKLSFTDMIKTVRAFKNKHRKAREIIIEDKANGPAVIDALKREIPGIIPFNPRGSKEERAMSASVLFEAGNVFIPRNAPWVHDYVEELVGFPGYKYDDSVDATTQFIIRSLESRPARSFSNNAW